MQSHPAASQFFSKINFILSVSAMVLGASFAVRAQTLTLLHSFSGGDGAGPWAGVTLDAAGNLYGTTAFGGPANSGCSGQGLNGCGTVFKLTYKNSSWVLSQLYAFGGGADSAYPTASIVSGPDGALYGTTAGGAPGTYACSSSGCGTVFRLQPPATFCAATRCPWTKTVLYTFTGGSDGSLPGLGSLLFDQAGNIYGTTMAGGAYGEGTVFELTHANGQWTEGVLYSFSGGADGGTPVGGLIFNSQGLLFGTTSLGGSANYGTVFKLTASGNGWAENVLHSFQNQPDGNNWDGAYPMAALVQAGHDIFYGTTAYGPGDESLGSFFQISGEGGLVTINDFPYEGGEQNPGPLGALTLDGAGNFYGTDFTADSTSGSVYEEHWSAPFYLNYQLVLFTGDDGNGPVGGVARDQNGNLYGTTFSGGQYFEGEVWEVSSQQAVLGVSVRP